jgi:protoporphyrinogen/coproporphyrinogen III oxidase
MKPIAVIGAGITGLTAAFYLKHKGLPVTVYEAGKRVGGVLQSVRKDSYLAEFGPNTILETSPRVTRLVCDAGLDSRRLDPDLHAAKRYLIRNRQLIAMPSSPLGFLTTNLFSVRAKLAVVREPFVAPRRDGKEESIAEFVVRRLGREFLDHAIDALVAGIYAGDPERLSVRQAFPKLERLEERYGSLIKGQILGARERKKSGEISKDRAPKFSFDEGLQVLPDTLGNFLGDAVRLNSAVLKVTQTADGWRLHFRGHDCEDHAEHSAVIYAGTAFNLAKLQIQAMTPVNLVPFSEIRHPPVASVVLGFRREDVVHPLDGFGMLIPRIEGFKILGTIFSSSLFPNRAPTGHVTLTSYVGGERYPEYASLAKEDLCELTRKDLNVLLGLKGPPTFKHCALFPQAIPQYNVGYQRYCDLMDTIEAETPGLFFAGHYRDGISLSDSIVSGCNVADRVGSFARTARLGTATQNCELETAAFI